MPIAMPKQRNHPHHHRRTQRGAGLELPRTSYAPITGLPTTIFPKRWILPRHRVQRILFSRLGMMLALLAVIVVCAALAKLLASL